MQTQHPLASQQQDRPLSAFVKECFPLEEAQELVRMSRTGFFRFRSDYGIRTIFGRRIHGADVVKALELARGRRTTESVSSLREYATKLMRPNEVCAQFGIGLTTLYTLRVRHNVPLLPGGTLHCDDIIASLEAERRGERRLASAGPIRVMTRARGKPRKALEPILAPGSAPA